MLLSPLHIEIITDIHKITTETVLIEVFDNDLSMACQKLDISLSEKIFTKIQNRPENQDFTTIYPENLENFQIIFFFVNEKNQNEKRIEIFKKFSKNVAYIPANNFDDALEFFTLTTYNFSLYKSDKKETKQLFFVEDLSRLSNIDNQISLLRSIITARNLVNRSPNDLNPESYVKLISEYHWKHFDVEIFGDVALRELGCNLIRAVGQGSVRESFMVILKPKKPVAGKKIGFIGKGVTFDAGGIQIKPDKAMLDMKCDMAGSAWLLGVALYLDSLEKLPAHTVFGFGFVENMTGSSAFKPLDVYTAYNGKTVEIHHTDAEGRLVLADVMAYVEKNFSVDHLITMATLTGACIAALGNDIAGIMGDDVEILSKISEASSLYEPVWQLPLTEEMKKAVKAEDADVKNLSEWIGAGSSMGAAFLSYFQGDAKLSHIDMAGPAYRTKWFGYMPAGATGWGVKRLSQMLLSLD